MVGNLVIKQIMYVKTCVRKIIYVY